MEAAPSTAAAVPTDTQSINTKWYHYITVEPTMFLYMFAFQLTSVIEQAFFVHKACKVNLNYSAEICNNLTQYNDINKEVQRTVSTFHQWNNISGHVVPIIIALYLGAWSDRRGRKLPLLLGLFGKLIYSAAIILNALNDDWPLEYVVYIATIPSAFTGSDVSVFASAFAYISDVSRVEQRTFRVTILEVCYLTTFPLGITTGSYLFTHVFNHSYIIMFSINGMFLLLAILYSILALKWRTTEKQRSITEIKCTGILSDFFDRQHVVDSIKTLTKSRPSNRRMYLWILMIGMLCYTFQRDERPMTYLYTQYKFKWNTEDFSMFKTVQSTTHILMLVGGIPIMTKLFKWRDTTIAMVGASNFAAARMFFAFAETPWVFYVGGFISSIGPVVGPIIRSMTSKVVSSSERGKVFALLSVCDNAVPLVSGILYSQVYNLTLGIFPGIFFLTAATQIIVFILMLCVHRSLNGLSLTQLSEYPVEVNDSPINAKLVEHPQVEEEKIIHIPIRDMVFTK